jgi:UDP-4-amino-4,6-dideoxy-N-acetyl-beta-L-altrosamine transaminase
MFKIPYGRQNITDEDINSVVETLKSDFITQGPIVNKFEKKFAKYVGAKYAIAVNNATSGLHLATLSLGVSKGDRVITTPITFAASANCVRYAGGEVWFADIDPDTYLLDIGSVKRLIDSKPKGFFKGIIAVDFAGLPVDMEKFRKLADLNNLWIIEDSCHAPGGYFFDTHGSKNFCGNGVYSDIGVFSFHPVKHIACGEGGMITTNSKKLFEKISLLRTHGITKENLDESQGSWFYEMQNLGYNYRLTDFQCALGISQLSRNDKGLKIRNKIAQKYINAFSNFFKFQKVPEKFYNAYHLFVIEVENRKELYDFLRQNGIFSQIHYIPIHTFPYYKKIGYEDANLLNSEKYYSKCISLPMYPTLSNKEQDYIINKIKSFYNV